MKRFHLVFLSLVLGLAGCVDTSNPVVTLQSAGHAILESNLKDYQATLSKSIHEEWGTQAKLDELKSTLAAHSKLAVGPAVLTKIEQGNQGWGYWGDVYRRFDIDLLDKTSGESVLKTEIACNVWVDRVSAPNQCPPTQPHCNNEPQYVERQDCRIIKFVE